MITPFDEDYKKVKKFKMNGEVLNEPFNILANWINNEFNVSVLYIYYDQIIEDRRPRLNVVFEFKKDSEKFFGKGGYNENKQKIILDKFRELTSDNSRYQLNINNVWVTFSSFDTLAKEEANLNVAKIEIEKLIADLKMPDLWTFHKQFGVVVFFFYTNEQLELHNNDGTFQIIKEKYFKLLKLYDEFDYININDEFIRFDSKEHFDKYHGGSWFAYDR